MKRGSREVTGVNVDYENVRFRIMKYDIVQKDSTPGEYYTIEKKDAAYIVALNDKNEIYILNEFRFPSNRILLNIPAGAIDEKYTPEETAFKELKEETGIIAGKIELLGDVLLDPGSQGTKAFAFLATELDESNVGLHNLEADEDIQSIQKYSIEEVKDLIKANKINCACTLSALNLLFLKKNL